MRGFLSLKADSQGLRAMDVLERKEEVALGSMVQENPTVWSTQVFKKSGISGFVTTLWVGRRSVLGG